MTDVIFERDRRLNLWRTISKEPLDNIEPGRLRELGIYGGAQGIWVDKAHTASPEIGLNGATVSILHTGRHYADDLSSDGVIYHYPNTSRPAARDASEINATKNAMTHNFPIFVILPGLKSQTRRCLKLGWICDFDDQNQQFLVLFGQEVAPLYSKAESTNEPFNLTEERRRKVSIGLARTGQQRFRFHVMSKYGHKCAVCDVRHPELLKAAHICGKAANGSDDWRNGIPLCSTHHDAFDNHFFYVDPDTGAIRCKPGVNQNDVGLCETHLKPLRNAPHIDALRWRQEATKKEWDRDTNI